jgi:hypothetical protein
MHRKPAKKAPPAAPAILERAWRMPRRSFLRGASAMLGLPLLDAMGALKAFAAPDAPASTKKAREVQAPVRMACIYFPNGVFEDGWFPKQAGTDFELPFSLTPLEKHRRNLQIFSGLDKQNSHQGDGHYAKTANFLTGLPVRKTVGKDISAGGVSIDQLCAQKIGHLTPLPSLELGIDPVVSGIDSNVGYTRLYACYVSWLSPNMPLAKEISPRLAYERLFSVINANNASAADRQKKEDRKALLDLVLKDANTLRNRLGRDDQYKLDEYLEAVRHVEKRIDFFTRPDSREWKPQGHPGENIAAPQGEPGDYQEHVRLMLDMITLAFWADSTRIGSFMFANDVSGRNFGKLIPGAGGSHHEFSHHEHKTEKIEPYKKINRWHNEQLAYLMDKLAAIKEGERTLLDNSMVLFGSSFSDGNSHDPANLPIILAGKGGGALATGRHVASPKGTPLCNLYVSMLEHMGTPVEKFGDSNGAIALG